MSAPQTGGPGHDGRSDPNPDRCPSRYLSANEVRVDGTPRPIARCILDAGHDGRHQGGSGRLRWDES